MGKFWIAFLWILPNTQQWMARYAPTVGTPAERLAPPTFPKFWQRYLWVPNATWAVAAAGLAIASILGMSRISEFLYFQF